MTNLEYLENEAGEEELFRLTDPATYQNCDEKDLADYASHMISRERIFEGTLEDIAARFISTIYRKDEIPDCEDDSKMYVTSLFDHDVIADDYFDPKYETAYEEILDLVKAYLSSEYHE